MDVERFTGLEKKYRLLEDEIEGFSYWSYSRDAVKAYIDDKEYTLGEAHRSDRSLPANVINLFRIIQNILQKGKIPKRHADIIIMNHERRMLEGGFYECPYTERISDYYKSSIVIERTYQRHHLKPVRTKNLLYTDWIEVKSELYYLLQRTLRTAKYRRICEAITNKVTPMLREASEAEKYEFKVADIVAIIARFYFGYLIRKPYFKRILQRVSPRLVLEVVAYNIDCKIMNELAKEMNIVTAELQHGIMETNLAYNYPAGFRVKQFPDKLFVFSDFWKETICCPIDSGDVIPAGYPYLEAQVHKYRHARDRESGKTTVLFISQALIGRELSGLAIALYRCLDPEKYRIIYKLHPGEFSNWEKYYPELSGYAGRIEIADSREHNIYEYFSKSDIQVGAFSTALYEGQAFGLKTYILDSYEVKNMVRLCEMGCAKIFHSCQELVGLMEADSKEARADILWKKNAFQNIIAGIDAILMENKGRCTE